MDQIEFDIRNHSSFGEAPNCNSIDDCSEVGEIDFGAGIAIVHLIGNARISLANNPCLFATPSGHVEIKQDIPIHLG